jgi:radical SAM protein with 4Fe4S-binding SPASM domain
LSIIFPAGRGQTDPKEFFSFEERQDIWDRYRRIKELFPEVNLSMPFLDYPSTVEDTNHPFLKGCVAGKSHCAIQTSGDVSPCKLSLDHIAGNIHEHSMASIWGGDGFNPFREFNEENINDPKCQRCKYLRLCRGGCRIVAHRLKNDFAARDPWCELDEKTISQAKL